MFTLLPGEKCVQLEGNGIKLPACGNDSPIATTSEAWVCIKGGKGRNSFDMRRGTPHDSHCFKGHRSYVIARTACEKAPHLDSLTPLFVLVTMNPSQTSDNLT